MSIFPTEPLVILVLTERILFLSMDASFKLDQLVSQLISLVNGAERSVQIDGKLPSERQLARELGVSRVRLRGALHVLEERGLIWRGVGRGTFIGAKPAEIPDIKVLSMHSNPAHVMRARLAVEPELAGLAASNATLLEVQHIREFCLACESAGSWTEYETSNARLHHAIAQASHNPVLIALGSTLDGLRRFVNRGRFRSDGAPSRDHHSFRDHRLIVEAISSQDPKVAAERMKSHLLAVEDRLLGRD